MCACVARKQVKIAFYYISCGSLPWKYEEQHLQIVITQQIIKVSCFVIYVEKQKLKKLSSTVANVVFTFLLSFYFPTKMFVRSHLRLLFYSINKLLAKTLKKYVYSEGKSSKFAYNFGYDFSIFVKPLQQFWNQHNIQPFLMPAMILYNPAFIAKQLHIDTFSNIWLHMYVCRLYLHESDTIG